MEKLFRRFPVWVWLVAAAMFIIYQASTCFALEEPQNFWDKKPCGFKEVELDQGEVPEKIWSSVAQLSSNNRSCYSTEQVNGRVFSFCVKYDQLANSYRVRSIKIYRGGRMVYSCGEKVCQ